MPFLGSTPVLSSGDGNFGSTITIGDGTAEDVMIKFDGKLEHAGISSTDKKQRIVINFNFRFSFMECDVNRVCVKQ